MPTKAKASGKKKAAPKSVSWMAAGMDCGEFSVVRAVDFAMLLVLSESQWPQMAAGPGAPDRPEANRGCHLATGRRAATWVRSSVPSSIHIAFALL